MKQIGFKKARAIPSSSGVGKIHEKTTECIKELAGMIVGDIYHLPITEEVAEPMRRRTQESYMGSLLTAAKHLKPRTFKICRRGFDIFVERTA